MKSKFDILMSLGILAFPIFRPLTGRAADWLIDPSPFRATIATNASASEVVLEDGRVCFTVSAPPMERTEKNATGTPN